MVYKKLTVIETIILITLNIKKRLGQKSFGFKKKQRFYAVAFCMVAIDLVK